MHAGKQAALYVADAVLSAALNAEFGLPSCVALSVPVCMRLLEAVCTQVWLGDLVCCLNLGAMPWHYSRRIW